MLPKHSADQDFWFRIENSLQEIDADNAMHEKLHGLPMHAPDGLLWQKIEYKMGQAILMRRILKFTSAIAAVLMLFFGISQLFTPTNNTNSTIQTAKLITPSQKTVASIIKPVLTAKNNKNVNVVKKIKTLNQLAAAKSTSIPDLPVDDFVKENNIISTPELLVEISQTQLQMPNEIISTPAPEATVTQSNPLFITNIILQPETAVEKSKSSDKAKKYFTPDDQKVIHPFNNLAIAMNYQPESVYNGAQNSLFHNVDLTASYNKEKVRFTTSFGMAYNEEQFELAVNYDQYRPVTVPGPNGTTDTISYTITNYDSELTGTEKHEYLTYGLGFARKLFAVGKFSTWINAGAGFAVKLNTTDLKKSTTEELEKKYNAEVNNISINQPIYNPWNVNFVTGIDFNYRLLDKLSFTFTPVSRWYFKPLLVQNNQATDELTLGFRTGVKFDF